MKLDAVLFSVCHHFWVSSQSVSQFLVKKNSFNKKSSIKHLRVFERQSDFMLVFSVSSQFKNTSKQNRYMLLSIDNTQWVFDHWIIWWHGSHTIWKKGVVTIVWWPPCHSFVIPLYQRKAFGKQDAIIELFDKKEGYDSGQLHHNQWCHWMRHLPSPMKNES